MNTGYQLCEQLLKNREETFYHSQRVANTTRRFCEVYELSHEEAELIETSAWLHDIGKAKISRAIVERPGHLSDVQMSIMKGHPALGAEYLMTHTDIDNYIVQCVLYHHERLNGKGYPFGQTATDIPLGARVIALMDSIDAMTQKRCYKEALTREQCFNELIRGCGTQFDAELVIVCLHCWNDIMGQNCPKFCLNAGALCNAF